MTDWTADDYCRQRKEGANTRYIRYHSSDDMAGLGELRDVTEPVAVVLRNDGSVDVYGHIAVVDQRPGFTAGDGPRLPADDGEPDELDQAEAEADRLTGLARRLGVSEPDLDEYVHEMASWPASDINNSGLGGQVAFLIRQAGPADAERMIREAAQQGTGRG